MDTRRFTICSIAAAVLAGGGCAASPQDEHKRKEMEADIDDILSYELDPLEYGEPKPCLASREYDSYRALGKRHLLFKDRKGNLWVNVLRGRCQGLNDNSVFVMKPTRGTHLCDMDRFDVVNRSDVLTQAAAAPTCALGTFKPVTAAQVEEIENRLEMR